jgi:hypothetical protein
MTDQWEDILSDFMASPPALADEIRAAEAGFAKPLPAGYKSFLLRRDGGEGFIGNHYLILWRASELLKFNERYEVDTYAPGFLMFGSTGGGDGFAFDTRTSPYRVLQVPFVGMSLDDGFHVADSFNELLQRMRTTSGSLF